MVADFDFRGMADILGTHIGFLEADFEAKVYTCPGEFGDEPLQCCLLSKSFKGHVASHAFVVLGGHPISSPGAGSDPFRSRGQTPWSGQKRLDRAACPVLVTSGVTDAQ